VVKYFEDMILCDLRTISKGTPQGAEAYVLLGGLRHD
jgi:hypothetical protein